MELQGKRILILVEDLYEDPELWYPFYRLQEAGAQVMVAGPKADHEYRSKHGYPCRSQAAVKDLSPADFDAVIIPGGFAPDRLRRYPEVTGLVRKMFEMGRLVAYICHAGWVPISAGIMRGVRTTSLPAIRDDLINAGAEWVDEPVVVDRNMISSRRPDDLPQFCRAIIQFLAK